MAKLKTVWKACGSCDHCTGRRPKDCSQPYPVQVPSRRTRRVSDDRREAATQAGMGLGVEAYNDEMGC